jgi:hypothetical protein
LGEGVLHKTGILQFFYRSKSAQGVRKTPPSPIFGALVVLLELGGKSIFSKRKKSFRIRQTYEFVFRQ